MFLQDEMEGLDLEGKTVEQITDLLEKLFSTVTLVNQGLVQFNHTLPKMYDSTDPIDE